LLYPMLIPVLLASMEATKAFLSGDIMNAVGAWVQMLALFDVIFLVATFWAFEFVIEV
jgi:heme exporter protein B